MFSETKFITHLDVNPFSETLPPRLLEGNLIKRLINATNKPQNGGSDSVDNRINETYQQKTKMEKIDQVFTLQQVGDICVYFWILLVSCGSADVTALLSADFQQR